jgi:hypothetical protein
LSVGNVYLRDVLYWLFRTCEATIFVVTELDYAVFAFLHNFSSNLFFIDVDWVWLVSWTENFSVLFFNLVDGTILCFFVLLVLSVLRCFFDLA